MEKVDLTSYKSFITNDASAIVRFYNSPLSAENENSFDEISTSSNYELAVGTTTLYARVDSNDKCFQIAKLVLTLFDTPRIAIADTVPICENESVLVDAGSSFDSYLWSTLETTSAIVITSPGVYSVTVTKNNGTIICSTLKEFTVALSNSAVINTIDIVDWTDNQNSVSIYLAPSSIGNYEYSIDGINYQDSAVFQELISGTYTVFVRDKNGCGIVTQEVYILNYPKFFTPNGDGFNDKWSVQLSQVEEGLKTEIFDRYGKLIKVLNNTSSWDGTYNGYALPSTDYWFVVHRANGQLYRGHFAMKR
nr:T9SS type B sorting domain-containing protein [Flavobacterium algicola]